MRTGKELMLASKEFTSEHRFRSWFELIFTLIVTGAMLAFTFLNLPVVARLAASVATGLLYVRLFVIYHDYQHRAILQNSVMASILMDAVGYYLLAPPTIWKRSHEHHHNNNSKLTISGIGSYPTVCTTRFKNLTAKQKLIYLINRHPLTIIFGYITLFVYWLNVKSFFESPWKHLDSLGALVFHLVAGVAVFYFFGATTLALSWLLPFFIAFGTGSYLFYAQHNFPQAKFQENPDWTYVNAALGSTSLMTMNPVMEWITGNIGYHHIHHLNSRIPFYRLREAARHMPELDNAPTTSLNPLEMIRCFRLKLWDAEGDRMVTMNQFRHMKTRHAKRRKTELEPATNVH